MRPSDRSRSGGASGGELQDDVPGVGCAWMVFVLAFELLKRLVLTVVWAVRRLWRSIRRSEGGRG